MPARIQDAAHPQRPADLEIVDRIAHHHGGVRVKAFLGQVAKPQLHLAFGVDVAQAQKPVKVGQQPALAGLLPQGADGRRRQDDLLFPGGLQAGKRLLRARHQRAGRGGRDIVLHVTLGQRVKAVAVKIEARPQVIIPDGKAEDLPVAVQVILPVIAVARQQTVERVHAQRHVVQQGAVPVPKDQLQFHPGHRPFRFSRWFCVVALCR